jgi:hypothetical protein
VRHPYPPKLDPLLNTLFCATRKDGMIRLARPRFALMMRAPPGSNALGHKIPRQMLKAKTLQHERLYEHEPSVLDSKLWILSQPRSTLVAFTTETVPLAKEAACNTEDPHGLGFLGPSSSPNAKVERILRQLLILLILHVVSNVGQQIDYYKNTRPAPARWFSWAMIAVQ